MAKYRKQIIFDIDTNVAQKILGESYRKLYDDIRKFLYKEGFSHIEGSGYMSNEPISNTEVSNTMKSLLDQYPYLTKCVRKIHQANISNIHSLEYLFEYDGTPGKFRQKDQGQDSRPSVLDKLKEKQEKVPARCDEVRKNIDKADNFLENK